MRTTEPYSTWAIVLGVFLTSDYTSYNKISIYICLCVCVKLTKLLMPSFIMFDVHRTMFGWLVGSGFSNSSNKGIQI